MSIEAIKHDRLNSYELSAIQGIVDYKEPNDGRLARVADATFRPIDRLGDAVFDTGVGEYVAKAVTKVIELIDEGAIWSVRMDEIIESFADENHAVTELDDIAALSLEEVDNVRGRLALKYKAMASAEGFTVGSVGAAGLVADIPLILGIAFRAAGEYATYYGFDICDDVERQYVLDLVSAASSPTAEVKAQAIAHLDERNEELTTHQEIREAETVVTMQFVEKLAESLTVRLARGKLGQAVPLVGGLIGGGFNGWYIKQVTDLAEAMYRERFLLRKHPVEQPT